MTPWKFEQECTAQWWHRLIKYPSVIKNKGKIPDWAFIKNEAEARRIAPWQFEKECTSEWWDKMVAWNVERAKHKKMLARRQKNMAKLSKYKKAWSRKR